MKKIYRVFFALMALVALAACSNDVDDVFDQSSSERINEAMTECKKVLTSAEDGWVMKYYPKANTTYGGYNILLKFDADGNVTAMSDALGSDVKATSHYKLEQSSGLLLSFDEYNKVIHYFSDPANPDGIGYNGKGMEGDLEFRVKTACADSVVMTGKKRNSKIVMTPLSKDADWAETINQLLDEEENMAFPKYSCTVNGATYQATTSYRTITFERTDAEEDLITVPYIITGKGLEFYKSITLNGATVNGFNYVGGDTYEFDATNGDVKMYGIVPPLAEQVTVGDWYLGTANMGAFAKQYFEYGNQQVSQYFSPCNFLALTSDEAGWGLYSNVAGYGSMLYLTPQFVDDTHITLACAHKFSSNGQYFYNWGQVYYTHALTGDSGQVDGASITYVAELLSGTTRNPQSIKLTDASNPDNWYILTRAAQEPFPAGETSAE